MSFFVFCIFTLILLLVGVNDGRRVAMKVVEEPSNFGMNNAYQEAEVTSLKMRVKPSNFSGPQHLQTLVGKCFDTVVDDYKYELCPFVNATQHEQSLRWNPYRGVLGVWTEWEIANNTFVAMVMRNGDTCGIKFRSVRVLFECSESGTTLKSVGEPSTCAYEMVLTTPLVCHPHAMLVYPVLPAHLQKQWDRLQGKLNAELYTQQGYNKKLHHIFEEAGLVLSSLQQDQLTAEVQATKQSSVEGGAGAHHTTLDSCKEEYEKLQKEVDSLKALLKQHGIVNNVSTPSTDLKPHVDDHPVEGGKAHYGLDDNMKDLHFNYPYEDDL